MVEIRRRWLKEGGEGGQKGGGGCESLLKRQLVKVEMEGG